MCYVFFISHMTSYNKQQPVLKKHSPSKPNFKIRIYLYSFSWKEYMDKNHLQPVCAQSPETALQDDLKASGTNEVPSRSAPLNDCLSALAKWFFLLKYTLTTSFLRTHQPNSLEKRDNMT